MKLLIFIIILLSIYTPVYSQGAAKKISHAREERYGPPYDKPSDETPLCLDDDRYIDGPDAYMKYVQKNLVIPELIRKKNLNYESLIVVFIDSLGNTIRCQTMTDNIYPECDAEAMTIIKRIKKWKPSVNYETGKSKPISFGVCVQFPPVWDIVTSETEYWIRSYDYKEWKEYNTPHSTEKKKSLLYQQPYKEKEIILVPKGYTGEIAIIYDQKNGEEKTYLGNRRAYYIPPCGILKTQFAEQDGWIHNEPDVRIYAYYENDKTLETLDYNPAIYPIDSTKSNQVYACCRAHNNNLQNYNYPHVITCGIDSLKNIFNYNGLRARLDSNGCK